MDYICNLVRECNQDNAWFVSCFLPCSVTGVWSSCSRRRSSCFTWTKFFWTSTTSWRLFLKSCSNINPMIWLIAPSERFYTHCTNSSAPRYSTSYLLGLVQYFCEDFLFFVLVTFFCCCDLLTLQITNHLSLIENVSESEVEAHLKRAMKHPVSSLNEMVNPLEQTPLLLNECSYNPV